MPLRQRDHWGSHMWAFIHTITIIDFDDSETNQRMAEPVLHALKGITMPCHHCQKHYDDHLETLDKVNMGTSMALFKWGWEFHNQINKKLGKQPLAYEHAVALWAKEI